VLYAIKKAYKSKQKQAKNHYKSTQKHTKAYKSIQIHTNGRAKGKKSSNKNLFLLLRGRDTPSPATKASNSTHPAKWRRIPYEILSLPLKLFSRILEKPFSF
jgi:hypothetical protein